MSKEINDTQLANPFRDISLTIEGNNLAIKQIEIDSELEDFANGISLEMVFGEQGKETIGKCLSGNDPHPQADVLNIQNQKWYRIRFNKKENLIFGSGLDISDIKENESQNAEYGMFFKMSLDMACIAGTDAFFKSVNPAFSEVLGYTKEELLSKPFTDFIHPDDIDSTYKEVMKLSEGHDTVDFENRYKTKNGIWKWLSWRSAANPQTGMMYAVARDITEAREKNIIISNQKTRLDNVIKGANLGSWEWNIISGNKNVNNRWAEIIGYTQEEIIEIIKDGWDFLIHPEDLENHKKALERHLAESDEFYEFEGRFHHQNGTWVWVQIRGKVYTKNKKGSPEWMFGTLQEITERKESEIKLERSNRQLDQFAYVVSHDLKAPLRGINTLVSFLEEDLGDLLPEDSRNHFNLLKDRTERLQNLISDILNYSRIGRTNFKEINVHLLDLVKEVIDSLDPPKSFKISFPEDLPTLFAPRVFFVQLFSNLISNAIKYNDKEKGTLAISWNQDDIYVYFHLSDNGPGIPEQYQKKVFQLFQTLQDKKDNESTGIGLSTVAKIIEELDGDILIKNNEGPGCTFTIRIDKSRLVLST